jgi:class 3 adenylate cyclase
MLPVHAYESLKHEEWVTDRLFQVTLLYADISGFTAWSSSNSPQEVITHLSEIYTAFDKICVRLKVYKVHTIGDCYVAMSATNNSETRDPGEECQVMLNFAEEMLHVLTSLHSASDAKLNMRIGLHTGDVVAGISGSKLIRYDIYGTDVLIANKMESNSVEGRINASEEVKRVLDERAPGFIDITFNKTIEIPEVGRAVNCYFVRNCY